jgi:hypothetical protein
VVLLGNHDHAATLDPELWEPLGWGSSAAREGLRWSREQLDDAPEPEEVRAGRWHWLAGLPRSHRQRRFLFVHGTPRNPLNEYIFPEDIYNERKMERNFELMDHCCFKGHTHIPGVWYDSRVVYDVKAGLSWADPAGTHVSGRFQFHAPEEIDHAWRLGPHPTLIDVGSVGQPRDGDPRACYVLFDGDIALFRRVDYDVGATVRKIHDVPDLQNFLGDRLRDGR